MRIAPVAAAAAVLGAMFVITVPHWSGPAEGRQHGYRGSSMIEFANKEAMVAFLDRAPPPLPADRYGVSDQALADPRPATQAYPALRLAEGLTAGEFMALQVAITAWVAPKAGCAFCHQGQDFAADTPRKQAAATMLAMTRTLNADWRAHTGPGGVTCYTCHRGQGVPPNAWFPEPQPRGRPMIARQEAWHEAATTVRDFFPDNGYAEYLLQDGGGRHQSYTALPTTGPQPPAVVARMYEVMMQMADGMGVNCGFCHNSRAFFDWSQSTPQRWTALSGIHLTRAINTGVLLPLAATIPQLRERVGAGGPPTTPLHESGPRQGNALATCATCHNGLPRPLAGQDLLHQARGLEAP